MFRLGVFDCEEYGVSVIVFGSILIFHRWSYLNEMIIRISLLDQQRVKLLLITLDQPPIIWLLFFENQKIPS